MSRPRATAPDRLKNVPNESRCPRCLEWKPRTEEFFQRDKGKRDGFRYECRNCLTPERQAWYRENRAGVRERNRALKAAEKMAELQANGKKCPVCKKTKPLTEEFFHRAKNVGAGYKPHCKDCGRRMAHKWALDHPDENRTRALEHYYEHPEERQEKVRQWQAANKEKVRRYKKKWTDENPEMHRANVQRRRARQRKATVEKFTDIEIFERDGWLCGICGKKINRKRKAPDPLSPSLDHIQALSRGGTHARANVQAAHLGYNKQKGAK